MHVPLEVVYILTCMCKNTYVYCSIKVLYQKRNDPLNRHAQGHASNRAIAEALLINFCVLWICMKFFVKQFRR